MERTAPTFRVTVHGPVGEHHLDVHRDQAILDAALRAGLELPTAGVEAVRAWDASGKAIAIRERIGIVVY